MRMLQLFCCAMVLSTPAQAAIYEYRYEGQPLEIDSRDRDRLGDLPEIWRAYSGVIRLDEDHLSRKTLINSNLYFSSMWVGPDEYLKKGSQFDGFGIQYFGSPRWALEFRFWIKTDRERNIVSARGSFLDGPPDGYISPGGDGFRHPNGVGGSVFYSSDEGGAWSEPILISGTPNPVPVPLPAAWALLGTAVAGAHAVRRVGALRRRLVPF